MPQNRARISRRSGPLKPPVGGGVAGDLGARPARPHQPARGVRRAPHQQVADLVRHRAPEQRAEVAVGRAREPLDAIDVHGGEHAGAGGRIDQRGAQRLVARRPPALGRSHQPDHQLAAPERHGAAAAARRRARHPRHLDVGRTQRLRRRVERGPQRGLRHVRRCRRRARSAPSMPVPPPSGATSSATTSVRHRRHQSPEPAHRSLPSRAAQPARVTALSRAAPGASMHRT